MFLRFSFCFHLDPSHMARILSYTVCMQHRRVTITNQMSYFLAGCVNHKWTAPRQQTSTPACWFVYLVGDQLRISKFTLTSTLTCWLRSLVWVLVICRHVRSLDLSGVQPFGHNPIYSLGSQIYLLYLEWL
jgi:hypothetical protein